MRKTKEEENSRDSSYSPPNNNTAVNILKNNKSN